MDNMKMIQRDRQPRISGLKAFIFITGVIVAINVIVAAANRFQPGIAAAASVALMLGTMWLTYRVIDRKVVEYNYILTDKNMVFQKVTGRREKTVLEVPYEAIEGIQPADDRIKAVRTYYFLCDRKAPGRYIMTFVHKGKIYGAVFRPEEKLVDAAKKRMG